MGQLGRYADSKSRERIDQIFEMRRKGHVWVEIAEACQMGVANVQQAYYRECRFRNMAFEYPFVEYIGTHTCNIVRKCLGEHALGDPQQLSQQENIKAMLCWPGVGTKTITDLSGGLEEAGYNGFDPDEAYSRIFQSRTRRSRRKSAS